MIEADLAAIDAALAALAAKHRHTVMAGRTHLQHALPVTFGYKAAVWLAMVRRHRQRLAELRPRVLVGQFAGAAGTLASLGDKGLAVHDALMDELGLARPEAPWHVARDGLAETVAFLGLVTGSLAKIATDVMLMMQTEVAEAFEPFVAGRGSSSTMPQKRNPISCEYIVAAARIVRGHVGLMLDAMAADHERATGPWQLEWVAIPEAFLAASGALRQSRFMLEGLIGRCRPHAPQPRPHRRPDRGRGGDDGAGPAHRPRRRPRPRLRRLPGGPGQGHHAAGRAGAPPRGHAPSRWGAAGGADGPGRTTWAPPRP